jgi:hypothetical protein
MMHRVIVVVELAITDPAGIAEALEAIDPARIPHFAGGVRVAVDPVASQVLDWLDE